MQQFSFMIRKSIMNSTGRGLGCRIHQHSHQRPQPPGDADYGLACSWTRGDKPHTLRQPRKAFGSGCEHTGINFNPLLCLQDVCACAFCLNGALKAPKTERVKFARTGARLHRAPWEQRLRISSWLHLFQKGYIFIWSLYLSIVLTLMPNVPFSPPP